ncbi:hypothetical protein FI667_g15094, partial [Globisporangium splendens]
MASFQVKRGRPAVETASADPAIVERRRKQRELKQRFRARKRNDVEWMKTQVSLLETTYRELYATKMASRSSPDSPSSVAFSPSASTSITLHGKYVHSKQEGETLRQQIAAMRRRIYEYERFIANVDGYFIRLNPQSFTPPLAHTALPSAGQHPRHPPPILLSEDAAQRIVAACYLDIVHRKWTGTCMSTGAHILGWRDKRYVDGPTLHFALTKHFDGGAGIEQFVANTWEVLTSERLEFVRAVQKATLGAKVLQVINDDLLLLQRRVFHAHLHTVSCINMLAFRTRTPKGYIVGYKSIRLPQVEKDKSAFVYDDEQRAMLGCDDAELQHVWVETLQYWVFDEDDIAFSDEEISHFIESDPIGNSDADDVSSPSPSLMFKNPGLTVVMGGTTHNRDANYISFFLIEVVSCIIRWENKVAASRLTFLDLSGEEEDQDEERM